MKEYIDNILQEIDSEVDRFDIYIENSLILSKQLYFNKIYNIESKFPIGSNEATKRYLNDQLHSLEYYFYRYLDFHQYYRSGSTVYDFKVAKIIANEMLLKFLHYLHNRVIATFKIIADKHFKPFHKVIIHLFERDHPITISFQYKKN